MADLVTDDRADRTVVHRRIRGQIEERRLQDARREDDLVLEPAVVRIHGLWRHRPLLAIDWLAEIRQLILPLETAGSLHVAVQIADVRLQSRVVAPLVGISDHHVHLGQLLERGFLRVGAHPGVRLNSCGHRGLQVVNETVHRRL